MYNYISADKPNRGRQPELDLSKFIAIFLMIACHCGIYFLEDGSTGQAIFDLLGGEFAAPVFMVCMGIGVVFSRHNQPELLAKRGLSIFILGYVLNLIRGTIPEVIVWLATGKNMFGLAPSFYMIDILPFAGIAMMLMGLLKKLKVEPIYQLLIGILMTGVGEILALQSTGCEWSDAICGLIWGTNGWSFFPLLNWFVYPAAGVVFGEILMHCNDKKQLYQSLIPIGFIGVAITYYQLFTKGYEYYETGSYYFMSIKNVILGLCFPMFSFALCYFITNNKKIANSRFVAFSSKNLNTLYCISWVLILWIRYFVYNLCEVAMTLPLCLAFMVGVFVMTYLLCLAWVKIKARKAMKRLNKE